MWPLLAHLLSSLLIPQVMAAAVPAVPLPQPINYKEFASTQITAHPFSTNPRGLVAGIREGDINDWFGPAPDCSTEGSGPQLEIFLINKDQCVIKDDSMTFKILVRNLGQQDSYNAKLQVQIPPNTTLTDNNLPNPYAGIAVPGNTVLEFHNDGTDVGVFQSLLSNNGTVEYHFTLYVDQPSQPFTVTAKLIYQSCGGRRDRYSCLQSCMPSCILSCQDARDKGKTACSDQLTSCGNSCTNLLKQCTGQCTIGTPQQKAACVATCNGRNAACNGACGAAKQQCDSSVDNNYNSCQNNCTNSCEKTCDRSIESSTSLTINGSCETPNIYPTAIPSKQPAIICGPGETSCQNAMPSLGFNWQNAKAWLDNPQLGVRFKEAIMSILPGDCSVISDFANIILPPFHDSLNRQGKPAADFMIPLYNSGADFSNLAHQNELLGITNELTARVQLQAIHAKYWQQLGRAIDQVLAKSQPTSSIRSKIDTWVNSFYQEEENTQKDLTRSYETMQRDRLAKFDPVATAAVNNAQQSICRACPSCGSDGGLANILPTVKQAYQQELDDRKQAYQQTHQSFLNPSCISDDEKPSAWRRVLVAALDAYDNGDSRPLDLFNKTYVVRWPIVFDKAWKCTYGLHSQQDKDADNNVRVNSWQLALNAPKAIAAKCEADKTFAAPVETTWCESNGYPEFVIKGAPNPAKVKDIAPPAPINGGANATVQTQAIIGHVCGGGPGDPYWANDCSCHCGEIINCGGAAAYCEACPIHPVTQDDVFITSQRECFLSKTKPYTFGAQNFPPSDYSPPPVH